MKPTTLELEIHGNNELKNVAKFAINLLVPFLNQYKDKKLFTSKGLTTKAIDDFNKVLTLVRNTKLIPLSKGFISLHQFHLDNNYGSLTIKISICLNGGSYDVTPKTAYCQYFDQTFYIGKMSEKDGTFLKEVDTIEKLTETYELNDLIDINEQMGLIAEFHNKKAELEGIQSKIKIPKDVYKYM